MEYLTQLTEISDQREFKYNHAVHSLYSLSKFLQSFFFYFKVNFIAVLFLNVARRQINKYFNVQNFFNYNYEKNLESILKVI